MRAGDGCLMRQFKQLLRQQRFDNEPLFFIRHLPQRIQLTLITAIMEVIFYPRRDRIAHVGPHTQIFDKTPSKTLKCN